MKRSNPGDSAYQNASALVSYIQKTSFLHPKNFNFASWDCPVSQTLPTKTWDKSCIFPLHRDWKTNNTANSRKTWPSSQISSGSSKCSIVPRQQETAWRTWCSVSKRWDGWFFTHLMGYGCLLSIRGIDYILILVLIRKNKQIRLHLKFIGWQKRSN